MWPCYLHMKICHQCKAEWVESHSPGRQETCLKCGADMHCCMNCKFYDPSRGDDCALNNTDPPRDKVRWNDCEEFVLKESSGINDPKGVDSKEDLKSKWDSLFKD